MSAITSNPHGHITFYMQEMPGLRKRIRSMYEALGAWFQLTNTRQQQIDCSPHAHWR